MAMHELLDHGDLVPKQLGYDLETRALAVATGAAFLDETEPPKRGGPGTWRRR